MGSLIVIMDIDTKEILKEVVRNTVPQEEWTLSLISEDGDEEVYKVHSVHWGIMTRDNCEDAYIVAVKYLGKVKDEKHKVRDYNG